MADRVPWLIASQSTVKMNKCTDKVVGDILAGWRYDISGITPEMRGDYEAHFAECERFRLLTSRCVA